MSTENSLWMGDIQPWMDEDFILKAFRHYNINPISVKLIHDRNTHDLKNFCFIYFENVEQANNCIFMLNGKSIPETKIKFKLNWANYYSTFNKSVYVGNLSPDVDDISLYKLFKEKYPSVHHASVVTDNGKSKGFGFILFRGEKDYEKCLTEMNGISFHGNIIKVSEQRKKEDDNKNNISNSNENNDNYLYNFNNINGMDLINIQNNPNISNNIDLNTLNKYYISNNLSKTRNNFNNNINPQISNDRANRNNINNLNNLNSFQIEQNKFLNPYNQGNINSNNNQNIINNIININNINKINNINYINDKNNIFNKNQIMNNNNIDFNNNYNQNINNILELSNHPSLFQRSNISNEKSDKDSLIINNKNSMMNNNNIINNNNNIKNSFSYKNYKNNNNVEYKIESLDKYDDITLRKKIRENLNKMYNYYMEIYQGDINKLKCKLYIY